MNKLTRTVGKAKAIQLRKGVGCHKKKNKARGHLAKLRGVLDPKREPTIPFRTKLGPVPVRVPTFRNENRIRSPFALLKMNKKTEHKPLQCWQHRQ